MEFWLLWLAFASIMFVGAASPGPDFVITVRNSVLFSRKAGLYTALGIGIGICVHMTYSLLGLAAVIAQSVFLFTSIKYIGAAYLIYIGFNALRSKGYQNNVIVGDEGNKKHEKPSISALRDGFIANLFNPKATMFFLALLPQFISEDTALWQKLTIAATAIFIPLMWFSFVSIVLNQRPVRRMFLKFAVWFDRVCGGLLMALGIRLALSKIN